MTGLSLTIVQTGEKVIDLHLTRFKHNLEHHSDSLGEAGRVMRRAAQREFRTSGAGSGGWEPLAESTREQKRREGLDPRILRAHRVLERSLTRKHDARHIERASDDTLEFGSTVDYLKYHQSNAPRTQLPHRPPVVLLPQDRRLIARALQRGVLEGVR